jgi:DNA-binding NarL/FixJ family response regulator
MNNPIRVLLADDHAVLRTGLRLLLTGQNEFEVVAEASTGSEALSLAEKRLWCINRKVGTILPSDRIG